MESLGIVNFTVFLAAGIILNITPGSDTVYILARSISQGRQAGVVSALGIATGSCLHTLAAACGLSIILVNSAVAFHIVKYAGACYLIYLGIMAFRQVGRGMGDKIKAAQPVSRRSIYLSGVLTNVLNPKVALFFLAFLPQFVNPAFDSPALSFLILGATFITTGTLWCLGLALFASKIAKRLAGEVKYTTALQRLSGTCFIGLGALMALDQ